MTDRSAREALKIAIDWVRVGHERGREFISLPSEGFRLRHAVPRLMDESYAHIEGLATGRIAPAALSFYEVPKKNGAGDMRRVPALSFMDKIAMTWAVVHSWPSFMQGTKWARSQTQPVDHSEPMPADPANTDGIENFLGPYRSFVNRTDKLRGEKNWIVNLDIRNFAANASLSRLTNNLWDLNAPAPAVAILESCARAWQNQMPGIPMGQVCTDPMLKLFLSEADERLTARFGDKYFRYVDDMRIACASEKEAKIVIEDAGAILEDYGLPLNDKKTHIDSWDQPTKSLRRQSILQAAARESDTDLTRPDWATQIYERWISPRMDAGATGGDDFNKVFEQTLYALGDADALWPLRDLPRWLPIYPAGGKHMIIYLERAQAGHAGHDFLKQALCVDGNGSDHYETFRHAMRLSMAFNLDYPKDIPANLATRPDYQRLFFEDLKQTRAPTTSLSYKLA